MKYLVILKDQTHFMTDWFITENCWNNGIFCIVNYYEDLITYDGVTWQEIANDFL